MQAFLNMAPNLNPQSNSNILFLKVFYFVFFGKYQQKYQQKILLPY